MGSLRFQIKFRSVGANVPGDIAELLADLSEPFQNIIAGWARHNQEKFIRSRGAELSGVDQAADTMWQPVTARYYRQKHGPVARGARQLYEDWLMVRTRALLLSMIDPAGFYQAVTATSAAFGTPLSDEDQRKVAANWLSRQVIFLDVSDKRMIQANIHDYLAYGHDYLSAKKRFMAVKEETREMDLAFSEAVNG